MPIKLKRRRKKHNPSFPATDRTKRTNRTKQELDSPPTVEITAICSIRPAAPGTTIQYFAEYHALGQVSQQVWSIRNYPISGIWASDPISLPGDLVLRIQNPDPDPDPDLKIIDQLHCSGAAPHVPVAPHHTCNIFECPNNHHFRRNRPPPSSSYCSSLEIREMPFEFC